jgi:transcriptional regulator with XRE-family HTH domain
VTWPSRLPKGARALDPAAQAGAPGRPAAKGSVLRQGRQHSRRLVRPVGPLVREWRLRRGRSQMDLALAVGLSTRHLSFIENGRTAPSPEVILALAEGLDVPLRERNTLLLAAGYAPRYPETGLDHPDMASVHAALGRLLTIHQPCPGVVLDREWNTVLANDAAGRMVEGLPSGILGPPANVFRLCLHPDGLARRTVNFPEHAAFLLGQLDRLRARSPDPAVEAIAREVFAYPNVVPLRRSRQHGPPDVPDLLIPWRLRIGDTVHSYFITLTKFATPQDITLDELTIELFYPADDATGAALSDEGAARTGPAQPQAMERTRDRV